MGEASQMARQVASMGFTALSEEEEMEVVPRIH